MPGVVATWPEMMRGQEESFLILLFPAAGLLMLFLTVRQTLRWRRFGSVRLNMDPFPGALGGQVGGTLQLRESFRPDTPFRATLGCYYSHISGSGKNRSRKESLLWQSEGFAHVRRHPNGTQLDVLFEVPEGLPSADAKRGETYHLWRLHVFADIPGADFDGNFDIPVYPGAHRAKHLRELCTAHPMAAEHRMKEIDTVLDLTQIPGGVELHYPAFRKAGPKIAGVVFGVLFIGGGLFAGAHGAPFLFPLLFVGIGAAVALGCLYSLLVSLRVRIDSTMLQVTSSLLGIPLRTCNVPRGDIGHLMIDSSYTHSNGAIHEEVFKLKAVTSQGRKLTIGFNLAGREVAEEALKTLAALTGLKTNT
jgi:hypothetical protein